MRRALPLLLILASTPAGLAQGPIEVPNPMAAHTLFIILITAAFLAWAASFSIQIMKEQTHRKEGQTLRKRRETILDKMAEFEAALESGTITKEQHKKRMKELRGELSRVIGKLQSVSRDNKNAKGSRATR